MLEEVTNLVIFNRKIIWYVFKHNDTNRDENDGFKLMKVNNNCFKIKKNFVGDSGITDQVLNSR